MSLTKNRIFYNLNMSFFDFKNLFDYKLLLILGLAIILLYIYYEIEYINYKIDLLSDSIYALKNKDVQSESNTLNKCNVSTVNANASNTDTESKSDVNTSDTESKSDVNASNVNESKSDVNASNVIVSSNLKENEFKKIIIQESSSASSSSISEYSDKVINIDINGTNTEKVENLQYHSENASPKHIEVYSNSSPKNIPVKYNELDLKKLNLPDIKNIAEKLMISTTKMVGDKSKMKTKIELIKEIVEK